MERFLTKVGLYTLHEGTSSAFVKEMLISDRVKAREGCLKAASAGLLTKKLSTGRKTSSFAKESWGSQRSPVGAGLKWGHWRHRKNSPRQRTRRNVHGVFKWHKTTEGLTSRKQPSSTSVGLERFGVGVSKTTSLGDQDKNLVDQGGVDG